jgi:nitrate/TMAO reductase-like tetraheme cytochrome c subunit
VELEDSRGGRKDVDLVAAEGEIQNGDGPPRFLFKLRGPLISHYLRPLFYLSRNLISRIGVVLTSTAAITLLVTFAFGSASNPYLGIVVYLVLPGVFAIGLLLIPVGVIREYRKERRLGVLPAAYPKIDFSQRELRRTALFVAVMTAVNVPIFAIASYRGTVYMESVEFCGKTCHQVMAPEYTAYQRSPHARVDCVDCHIGPGASWFVKSKLSGSYQVLAVTFNLYPRPIPTPVHNLRPARETCEQCHWPAKFSGDKFIVKTKYGDDEKNAPVKTVLLLHIGGKSAGNSLVGIHGRHLGVSTYVATDDKRQVIPWVDYKDANGNVAEFLTTENPPSSADLAKGERRVMDCMDCHNRPTHAYDLPEDAVNRAMAADRISPSLPFAHKVSVELLRGNYPSRLAAQTQLPEALREYYRKNYFAVFNGQRAQIELAAETLLEIYNGNIFPEMNVTWGTYPSNLGHADFPGCFRCHDGNHKSKDGRVITQDCNACHNLLAMEEPDPKILRDLAGGS